MNFNGQPPTATNTGGATATNQTTQIALARATVVETTPTTANVTSVTLLAANASRKTLEIQNDSAANIMISISGLVLTGIVPTATNIGRVLTPGSIYFSDGACPVGAVTGYQSSGSTLNSIYVAEG